MDAAALDFFRLPPELRLRVLSFLPPNLLALSARLSCKDAAQHFGEEEHRTVRFGDELAPPNTTTAALQSSMRRLTLRQRVGLLAAALKGGIEANVELVWGIVQQHVFPELLHTQHYRTLDVPDVGSVAVASGLAHLLPCMEQRCSGLVDPARTLEAAALHCDLAGLQAAWGLLQQRLRDSHEALADPFDSHPTCFFSSMAWQRVKAAAAGSATADAIHKVAWVQQGVGIFGAGIPAEVVCRAADASGDWSRMRLLSDRHFTQLGEQRLPVAAIHSVSTNFIERMIQEGDLPPAGDDQWRAEGIPAAAAESSRDSAGKLRWLAGQGVAINTTDTADAAARHGNLEALQFILQAGVTLLGSVLLKNGAQQAICSAVVSGNIPTVCFLRQAGLSLHPFLLDEACFRGDLPMLRWLLEAGCPLGRFALSDYIGQWPCRTPADSKQLVQALQLLAAAGVPALGSSDTHPLEAAAEQGHPWAVWRAVLELMPLGARVVPEEAAFCAGDAGCGETIAGLVQQGWMDIHEGRIANLWYASAAKNGDRGLLAFLLMDLELPLHEGVLMAAIRQGAPVPALRWLVQHGAPLDAELVLDYLHHTPGPYYGRQARQELEAWVAEVCGVRAIEPCQRRMGGQQERGQCLQQELHHHQHQHQQHGDWQQD